MDGTDRDVGWEDLGSHNQQGPAHGAISGKLGTADAMPSELTDTVTGAMVSHFARELTQGSMSLWPQLQQVTRQYFNVTHAYVLRKALWQLVPLNSPKKKSTEGELGTEQKDWGVRVYKGLEVDTEVPDAYIPTMGFVTYVLLFCLIQGLQERFTPDLLSSTLTFALVVLIMETTAIKATLFVVGVADAPVLDLIALLGYKYFYLDIQLAVGLLVGGGWKPQGALYKMFELALVCSCGIAMWQVLRRHPRLQPAHAKECGPDVHKVIIKVLPVLQAMIYWLLLPSWSRRPHGATEATVRTTAAAVAAAALGNATAEAGATPAA